MGVTHERIPRAVQTCSTPPAGGWSFVRSPWPVTRRYPSQPPWDKQPGPSPAMRQPDTGGQPAPPPHLPAVSRGPTLALPARRQRVRPGRRELRLLPANLRITTLDVARPGHWSSADNGLGRPAVDALSSEQPPLDGRTALRKEATSSGSYEICGRAAFRKGGARPPMLVAADVDRVARGVVDHATGTTCGVPSAPTVASRASWLPPVMYRSSASVNTLADSAPQRWPADQRELGGRPSERAYLDGYLVGMSSRPSPTSNLKP